MNLCVGFFVVKIQKTILMVLFRAVFQHPLQEAANGFVTIIIGDTNLLDCYLGRLTVLETIDNVVKGAIETVGYLFLQVETYESDVILQLTILQIKDIGKCVKCYTEGIFSYSSVEIQIVAGNALAAEIGALLTEVVGERTSH